MNKQIALAITLIICLVVLFLALVIGYLYKQNITNKACINELRANQVSWEDIKAIKELYKPLNSFCKDKNNLELTNEYGED